MGGLKMIIKVKVKWRGVDTPPHSFKCDRASLVDFMKRKAHRVDWLIADVGLTRWVFDGWEWKTVGLAKYVPGQAMVKTTHKERMRKLLEARIEPCFWQYPEGFEKAEKGQLRD